MYYEADEAADKEKESEIFISEERVFRIKKPPVLRNSAEYKSPIIKKDRIILDPEKDIIRNTKKVVVRRLGVYQNYE